MINAIRYVNRSKTLRTLTVLLLTASLMVNGCAQNRLSVATFPDPTDGCPQALLTGTLESDHGCLVIIRDGITILPFFPVSAVGATTDNSVVLYNVKFQLGDTVRFGGGSYDLAGIQKIGGLKASDICLSILQQDDADERVYLACGPSV